jgi:syringate O-demethylase
MAGLSTWIGYSANEGKFLTLAMMDKGFETPAAKSAAVG